MALAYMSPSREMGVFTTSMKPDTVGNCNPRAVPEGPRVGFGVAVLLRADNNKTHGSSGLGLALVECEERGCIAGSFCCCYVQRVERATQGLLGNKGGGVAGGGVDADEREGVEVGLNLLAGAQKRVFVEKPCEVAPQFYFGETAGHQRWIRCYELFGHIGVVFGDIALQQCAGIDV